MEGLISLLAHPGARLGAAASLLHCTCRQAGFGFPRWWAVLTVGSNAGRAWGQRDIFVSAVPGFQIPPAARASRLHSSVLCFGASGKLGLEGPTGEKRWLRACCVPGSMNTLQHPVVLKGPCNNQGKRALPQRCPHGALPVHP